MKAETIFKFVQANMPKLTEPQVYMKDINQDFYGPQDWREGAIHFCLNMPVPASASIANQGIAILYDECNRLMGDDQADYQLLRGYYPEDKLIRAMKKEGIRHFDKETFHEMRDFDFVGFSSFYAMQYLSIPQMLELSAIPLEAADRGDDLTTWPIIVLGGIQAYSCSPLHPMLDIVCVGEGEEQLPALMRLYKKFKEEGRTKTEFLIKAAQTIQGILVPRFYKEEYYPADHPTKPNQISYLGLTDEAKEIGGIPEVVVKACVDFANTHICTKPFVTNAEGAEMSIGSVMVANGCGNF